MNRYVQPLSMLKLPAPAWGAIALALLACPGCMTTAPAPRHYTLDMTPSGQVAEAAECGIEVVNVRTVDALGRPELLIKKSAIELEYYAVDRWAGALDELVEQKLEAEFAGTRDPFDDDQTPVPVEVEVLAFQQEDTADGARASVRLRVELTGGGGETVGPIVYAAQRDVAPNPAAVVEGLSRALEEIAAAIARDANRLAAPGAR